MRDTCAVLSWAASGAMALTGMPDGMPVASPAPALAMLGQVTAEFTRVTGKTGITVDADPAELIAGRAGFAGLTRGGRVSAGGASFLLRADAQPAGRRRGGTRYRRRARTGRGCPERDREPGRRARRAHRGGAGHA